MAKKTAGSSSLKAENGKAIWLLVSADIIAIVLVLTGFAFTQASLSELAQSAFVRGLVFAAVGPLAAVFLNDLLPSNVKASIVFWRIKDALPGHRAFSEHAEAAPRIDIAALKKRVGEFPQNPRYQNSCWYKLFQKYRSNVIVSDSRAPCPPAARSLASPRSTNPTARPDSDDAPAEPSRTDVATGSRLPRRGQNLDHGKERLRLRHGRDYGHAHSRRAGAIRLHGRGSRGRKPFRRRRARRCGYTGWRRGSRGFIRSFRRRESVASACQGTNFADFANFAQHHAPQRSWGIYAFGLEV